VEDLAADRRVTGSVPGQPGGSAAGLSRISLGTMRLSKAGAATDAAQLLSHAHASGITTFHCSSEYETYPLFRGAWQEAGLGGSAKVIAKVAAPHYGENSFSPGGFRSKIEAYLRDLAIPRLDVVQWLLRYDLKQDEARVRIMRDAAGGSRGGADRYRLLRRARALHQPARA
jgi:aryl-alcohol dehydrogenase-like predicted oxidoreductase